MDESRDAQAVLWFVILNGVAARDDASGLDGLGMSALQNGADILFRQTVRHTQEVHRNFRLAAHGVHVAQRVRRGDLAEEIRIIHNGVYPGHDRQSTLDFERANNPFLNRA